MDTSFIESLVRDRVGRVNVLSLDSLENAGGFSGARIWKVETEIGPLCVRRWPRPHPTKERLKFIHTVLFHLEKHQFDVIAAPLATNLGESWTEISGHFWEVTKWLPGKSNFWLDKNELKLRNAMASLARFHKICQHQPAWQNRATSPGITHRIERLSEIDAGLIRRLSQSIDAGIFGKMQPETASRICEECQMISIESGRQAGNCLAQISRFNGQHALSPCLRDIWHDHVLFSENCVTGLIDYGALNVDAPACDFARLLGSLAMDNQTYWKTGCDAVTQILPEMQEQIPMIKAIDFANVVLAGLNWINWLFIEKRQFPIYSDVLARLEHIRLRLVSRSQ